VYATIASPAFTGTPTAPTAPSGTNTTQLATTAFVTAQNAFVPLNEGNGIGYAINGRVSANYGNIGLSAVDLGTSTSASSTKGATADYTTISGGRNNTVSQYDSAIGGGNGNIVSGAVSVIGGGLSNVASGDTSSISGGSSNTSSGEGSYSSGFSNTSQGKFSSTSNAGNYAKSFGETNIGLYGTSPTPTSATTWVGTDRIYNIGVGTSGVSLADGFTILKNGLATLPSVTNTLIQAETTGKVLITREYINRTFTVATLPTPASGVAYATVTDAMTPTYLGVLVGGGAIVTPVFYNGTTWVSH